MHVDVNLKSFITEFGEVKLPMSMIFGRVSDFYIYAMEYFM